jgi:hypothetical protein
MAPNWANPRAGKRSTADAAAATHLKTPRISSLALDKSGARHPSHTVTRSGDWKLVASMGLSAIALCPNIVLLVPFLRVGGDAVLAVGSDLTL